MRCLLIVYIFMEMLMDGNTTMNIMEIKYFDQNMYCLGWRYYVNTHGEPVLKKRWAYRI